MNAPLLPRPSRLFLRYFWALGLISAVAVLPTCDSSSNEGNSGGAAIQLSVNLPASVAVESESSQSLSGSLEKLRTAQSEVTDDLREAFDIIREFAGIAEALGAEIGGFLVEIEADAASGGYDFSETITVTEDGLLIQAGPSSAGRTKSINIWDVSSQIKILEADWDGEFRGEGAFARGTIRMNGALFDVNGMFIEMDFDTASEEYGQSMSIRVRGIPDSFDTLSLFAANNGSEVTVSGNVYFPNINVGDSDPFFEDSQRERSYMFVASADVESDIAAIDIALPATDVTVASGQLASIFDNYSYGDVYKAAIFDWIDGAGSSETQLIKLYIQNLGFNFSTGTVDELAVFIEDEVLPTLSGNDAQEVAAIVFAFQLENTFYADRDGLVSNGTDVPSEAYQALAENLVDVESNLLEAPADVRSLGDSSSSLFIDFDRPDYP